MSNKTAIIPETGERFELVGGEWVPLVENRPTRGQTLARNTLGSLFESTQNLVNTIPETAQGVGNAIANPVINAANFLRSGDVRQLESDARFSQDPGPLDLQAFQQPMRDFNNHNPVPDLRLPTSDRDSLFAAAQMLGEGAAALRTGDFGQFSQNPIQQQAQTTEAGRQAFPNTALAGDLLGPALLITGAKSPTSDSRAMIEAIRQKALEKITHSPFSRRQGLSGTFPNFRGGAPVSTGRPTISESVLKTFEESSVAGFLRKNLPVIREAGMDGFVLSTIQGGDPLEVAAAAAGAQGANRAAIALMTESIGKGKGVVSLGGRVAGTAASLAAIFEMVRLAAPGGQDQGIDTMGQSFIANLKKILLTMGAAYSTSLMGFGRINSKTKAPMDAVTSSAEAITSIPRNMIVGLFNKWLSGDQSKRTEETLNAFSSNPYRFGESAMRRFDRVVRNGGDLSEFIDSLESANKDFRKFLEDI